MAKVKMAGKASVNAVRDVGRVRRVGVDERIAAVLEALADAALLLDRQGQVVLANAAAVHFFEVPKAELVGRHAGALFSEQNVAAALNRTLASDTKPMRFETRRALPNGVNAEPVEVTLGAVDLGVKPSVLCTVRNATDSKRAERELALSEARFNKAQRIARIGSWEWDVESDRHWWSDELYKILEEDPTAYGASFDNFIRKVHADDRQALVAGKENPAVQPESS